MYAFPLSWFKRRIPAEFGEVIKQKLHDEALTSPRLLRRWQIPGA